ncbi:MAG: hypothetical protein ACLTGT_06495 [Oscillospiraceae bacterium]
MWYHSLHPPALISHSGGHAMGIIPCEIPLLEFDPEQTAVIGPDYE